MLKSEGSENLDSIKILSKSSFHDNGWQDDLPYSFWSFLKNLLQSVTNGVLKSDKKFHEFKSNHYKKL